MSIFYLIDDRSRRTDSHTQGCISSKQFLEACFVQMQQIWFIGIATDLHANIVLIWLETAILFTKNNVTDFVWVLKPFE